MQRPRQAKQSGLQSQKRGGFLQTDAGEAPGPLLSFTQLHDLRFDWGTGGCVENRKCVMPMLRTD